MLHVDTLRNEIEAALAAPDTADERLAANRQLGLRFIVEAREGQTQAEIASAFAGLSDRFEVRPFFTDPADRVGWRARGFVAGVPGVAFDDVSGHPWDIAHAARAAGGLHCVAPDVPSSLTDPLPEPAEAADDPAQGPPVSWGHLVARVPQAWTWITERRGEGRLGFGVNIGHPDTGWTAHPVWRPGQPNLNKAKQWNLLWWEGEQTNAEDRLDWGLLLHPGHGTHTAAVIAAPKGGPVQGVAPNASVVPIRCITSVLTYGQTEIVDAVHEARKRGCGVISISWGGTPGQFLREAIQQAVAANIIVVAASGQPFGAVGVTSLPAGYAECIAVAGVESDGGQGVRPWEPSHRGHPDVPEGRITISAPAASIYTAKANQANLPEYHLSNGTSYATAFVAGAAALWLSCHFPTGYARRDIKAQDLFRRQIRGTAIHPPRFDRWFYGLVNVEGLISTLPPPERSESPEASDTDISAVRHIAGVLGADRARVRQGLAETLGRAGPPAADDSDSLEGFMLEISHILHADATAIQALSQQFAADAHDPAVLAAALTPKASSALAERLATQG